MANELIRTLYGPVPHYYQHEKLSKLCVKPGGVQTGPFGSQLHQRDYVAIGTPIITVEHLGENRIIHSNLPKVSDKDRKRLQKYELRTGDIVFSRVGSVDRRALVRETENGWLFSGRCLRVRPNRSRLDPGYLSYFFGLPTFKDYINRIAVGATMPSLNTKILGDVPIYFPSLNEQHAIAHILGTLDDKIELNRQMNQTLEAIARAIFKSWFVDFDPVWAKINGEQPYGMDAETAALFSAAFTDSSLGPIPEGWNVASLGQIANLRNGKRLSTSLYSPDGNNPVFGSNGQIARTNEVLSLTPVVAIGRVGAYCGSVFRIDVPSWVTDNAIVVTPKPAIDFEFLYYRLSSLDLRQTATGSAQPLVTQGGLKAIQVIRPPRQVLDSFGNLVRPLAAKAHSNTQESHTLAELRDTQLPKLISGQLRVPDAERFVEDTL